MKELEYPFDAQLLLSKKKRLKRELLAASEHFLEIKVAILGGSTTSDVRQLLELFLLHHGIKPSFFESEYNRFYEDAVFGNPELEAFQPDVVYLHTGYRNLHSFPALGDTEAEVSEKLQAEYGRFVSVWEALARRFRCTVIQNNFEYPDERLLGSKDATDVHGRVNFITRLNLKFAEYAEAHSGFLIHDLNYLAAQYGLECWHDPSAWYLYKYAQAVPAIPCLADSVAKIIKALYGKNKKAFALDLDNTLWGGIVGDDGVEQLAIGQETARSEAFTAFQSYLKAHAQMGVLLNIDSKNEMCNAIAGLEHPEGVLKQDDFIVIKANWAPKSQNLAEIAQALQLGVDSIVFVDDNPAEREIIRQSFPTVAVPELGDEPAYYARILDRSGYFECVGLSREDLDKQRLYQQNARRTELAQSFTHYDDYLRSLQMRAQIAPFAPLYMQRIAQLTNKSNQFNLTTRRYTQAEIEAAAENPDCITLYGKLTDRFGDNGIVSVVIGERRGEALHLVLWLMSCRVLKRDMEYAMMDALVAKCRAASIQTVYGYYYPTAKNAMVRAFYADQGFAKIAEDEAGNTTWSLDVNAYQNKNQFIKVED